MTEKAKKLGNEPVADVLVNYNYEKFKFRGLNKREYFAGLFMQALIANPERYKYISERVQHGMPQNEASAKNAHKAVLLADALLEELAK